jgi:hypothetical protein
MTNKLDGYQSFIHQSRYARWMPDEGRRENWNETVDRYCDYMLRQAENNTAISKKDMQELRRLMG